MLQGSSHRYAVALVIALCFLACGVPCFAEEMTQEQMSEEFGRRRRPFEAPVGAELAAENRLFDSMIRTGYTPCFLASLRYIEADPDANDVWRIYHDTPPFYRRFLQRLQAMHYENPGEFLAYVNRVLSNQHLAAGDVDHDNILKFRILFDTLAPRIFGRHRQTLVDTLANVMTQARQSGVSESFFEGIRELHRVTSERLANRRGTGGNGPGPAPGTPASRWLPPAALAVGAAARRTSTGLWVSRCLDSYVALDYLFF